MGNKGALRALADVITLPAPGPGFIGEGHTAVHVMEGREFARTDPFIMLADDRIDLRREPARAVRIRTLGSKS